MERNMVKIGTKSPAAGMLISSFMSASHWQHHVDISSYIVLFLKLSSFLPLSNPNNLLTIFPSYLFCTCHSWTTLSFFFSFNLFRCTRRTLLQLRLQFLYVKTESIKTLYLSSPKDAALYCCLWAVINFWPPRVNHRKGRWVLHVLYAVSELSSTAHLVHVWHQLPN